MVYYYNGNGIVKKHMACKMPVARKEQGRHDGLGRKAGWTWKAEGIG